MKAEIIVDMDNAAFTPNAGTELARILRAFAEKVEGVDYHIARDPYDTKQFERDYNGNNVATLQISDESIETTPRSRKRPRT